ncbi:MAG: hypothetical protein RQ824_10435, partial [bacterium]|nr:hypothetical protein [bacterium]
MKRILTINFLAVFFLCSFFSADAMALGIGLNLTGGGGVTEWEIKQDYSPHNKYDEDVDVARGGLGFILDTTVAKNSLFNYRFNIGSEAVEYDIDGGGSFETKGWFMAHDFGFGIIKKKNLRLWAGPELRLSYSQGELENNNNIKLYMATIGIGPVVGLNLNFRKNITLALKVGALSM